MMENTREVTQVYTDLRSLRDDIKKKLKEGYRQSDIRIIDRQNYNLNDYFL